MLMSPSSQYWQTETTNVLLHILQSSSYAPVLIRKYSSFLCTHFVPLLGPSPSQFRAMNTQPVSFMSDDHTPVEFVWVIGNTNASSSVHVSIEPLGSDGTTLAAQNCLSNLKRFGHQLYDFDLTWAQACQELLVLPDASSNMSGKILHSTECFIGVNFTNNYITGRAYFYPALRAKALNVPMERLITQTMNRLGVGRTWSRVISYMNTLPVEYRPSAETVGVDCISPSRNRVKVYLYTQLCTLNGILGVMSLGGQLRDEAAMKFRSALTRLWAMLWPGVRQDQPLSMKRPRRYPNGFLMYFEMSANKADPIPKIYLPVRHFCESDAQIADAICKFYTSVGKPQVAKKYMNHVRKSLAYRDPSKRTGYQPYLGFCVKGGSPEISHYFSPEAFAPERRL